jgi:hypothetical protein
MRRAGCEGYSVKTCQLTNVGIVANTSARPISVEWSDIAKINKLIAVQHKVLCRPTVRKYD